MGIILSSYLCLLKVKRMHTRAVILIGIISITGFSCEKNINISLHHAQEELVVDGSIENGKPPKVVLTRSLNYFSEIDTTILQDLFVHDAKITVSDKNRTVTLVEYSRDTLLGHKYYYYAPDSNQRFLGRRGNTYLLHIQAKGKSYQAETSIPAGGFRVDSIWWAWGNKNGKADTTKAYLMVKIIDPAQPGNCARYFTKRNSEPFYAGLSSVADDQVTNGTVFDFQIDRGMDKNTEVDFDEYGYFDPGDTVTFKFCNIDRNTFNFWQTWEYAWSNNSNPFSTPTKVLGNIPGALGYWGGYAAQYRTIIIKN